MSRHPGKMVVLRQTLKRGLAAVYRQFAGARKPGELVILNYHSIQPDETFSTSPKAFAQQLEFIAAHFRLLSLDEWLQQRGRETTDGRPAAMVSFDDGFENFYSYAYPILQQYKVPALVFVTTGFITGDCDVESRLGEYRQLRPMSWSQLRAIQTGGVMIGSHTHRHLHLGRATRAQIAEELSYSKQLLEDQLGAPIKSFAYPYGQPQHIGRETMWLLEECGYATACSAIMGVNSAQTNPYLLRRVRIDAWDTFADFQAKVEGGWDFIGHYQMLHYRF